VPECRARFSPPPDERRNIRLIYGDWPSLFKNVRVPKSCDDIVVVVPFRREISKGERGATSRPRERVTRASNSAEAVGVCVAELLRVEHHKKRNV